MTDGENKQILCFFGGVCVGIILTALLWFFIADEVEKLKVNEGYLTYQHRTYKVTLYDTLDTPEKEK